MKTKITSKTRNLLLAIVSLLFAITFVFAFNGIFGKTAHAEATGITGRSISLSEDITVKYATDATADEYLLVEFNGNTTKITEHTNGVFAFKGVTPQLLNEVMTVGLYSADDTLIGEEKQTSVAGYLYEVLAMSYEQSGCTSERQFTALRELAVDLLEYGSSAQVYTNYDTGNLANGLLTSTQKELATDEVAVSGTDKNVVDNDQADGVEWVGAGVRFDYKLGLYFVFQAQDTANITLKIGEEVVDYSAYGNAQNQYVAYYDGFTALDMNTPVTAVLYSGENQLGSFTYSLKSYVYSKGGQDTALANLVKATYAYGFAATAYAAEYTVVNPTFENPGYITMSNARGYDFTNTIYAPTELPAFNDTDYTVSVVKNKDTGTGIATTTYTLKKNTSQSFKFLSDDVINFEDNLYSEYTYDKIEKENLVITRDNNGNFVLAAKDGETVEMGYVAVFGGSLTFIGNVNITAVRRLSCNENLYIGTDDKPATVYYTTDASSNVDGVGMWNGADLYVKSGSKFTINCSTSNGGAALNLNKAGTRVYVEEGSTLETTGTWAQSATTAASDVSIIVDGTFTTVSKLQSTGSITNNSSFPYSVVPLLWVRSGNVTLGDIYVANHLIVGSETTAGTLTVNGKSDGNPLAYGKNGIAICYAFINGTVNLNAAVAGKTAIDVRGTAVDLIIHKEVTITTTNCDWGIGQWTTLGTYKFMIEDGATFTMTQHNATTYGMFNLGKASSTKPVYIIYWTTKTVNIDGAEKDIVVMNYTKYTASYSTKGNALGSYSGLVEGAEYTTGTTTFDAGRLGTFTNATTSSGDTIYYKTAEWNK